MVPEIIFGDVLKQITQVHSRHIDLQERKVQLQALERQLDHRLAMEDRRIEMAEVQAALARDVIKSLIDKRVDATRSGFESILLIYAEQLRHYQLQHEKYVDAEIAATTPYQADKCKDARFEIDKQMRNIRKEARLLYREMNKTLIAIGGAASFHIQRDIQTTLMLEG